MSLFSPPNLAQFIFGFLKNIFLMLFSLITQSHVRKSLEQESENRPSPLLVPLPLDFMIQSNREHLTVLKRSTVIARVAESCDDNNDDCAVCLMVMKGCDPELRGLPNCSHVFHKDCIDAWIDKCKITCPVCRSDMWPGGGEKFKSCGEDPWRRERMMYLFGEDYDFV